MEKIRINRSRLSDIIWRSVFENSSCQSASLRAELFQKSESLDDLRVHASYNTGSIGSGAIWALFSLCLFFKPKAIAEIGTFIGKSTFSMACAMDARRGRGRARAETRSSRASSRSRSRQRAASPLRRPRWPPGGRPA